MKLTPEEQSIWDECYKRLCSKGYGSKRFYEMAAQEADIMIEVRRERTCKPAEPGVD